MSSPILQMKRLRRGSGAEGIWGFWSQGDGKGGERRVPGLRTAPSSRTKPGKPDRMFTSLEIKGAAAARGLTRAAGSSRLSWGSQGRRPGPAFPRP